MVFMTDTDEPEAARKRGLDVLKKLEESEALPKFSVSMGAAAFPYAGKITKVFIWLLIMPCIFPKRLEKTSFM